MGGFRGNVYAVHLKLTGKPIVDFHFLLVITELFFARCYGSGAKNEYRLEVAVFEGGGSSFFLFGVAENTEAGMTVHSQS